MSARPKAGTTNAEVLKAARRLNGPGGTMTTGDRLDAMERFLADIVRGYNIGAPLNDIAVRQLAAHAIALLSEQKDREAWEASE